MYIKLSFVKYVLLSSFYLVESLESFLISQMFQNLAIILNILYFGETIYFARTNIENKKIAEQHFMYSEENR